MGRLVPWRMLIAALLVAVAAESSAVHLVQVATEALRNRGKRGPDSCLRFMHIPKTGGTSIDLVNLRSEPRAFDSLMLRTFQRLGMQQNWSDTEMVKHFEEVHQTFPNYVGFVSQHLDAYHFLPQNGPDQCEDLHTPPSRSALIRRYFTECRSFCALRDPLERFWSAFQDWHRSCDLQEVEELTIELLEKMKGRPYWLNCFFVPQVELVYGIPLSEWTGTETARPFCDRFLYQENLTEGFDAFMAEMGRPDVRLEGTVALAGWSHCSLTAQQLTGKTKQAVFEFYRADYEAFGFPPPF